MRFESKAIGFYGLPLGFTDLSFDIIDLQTKFVFWKKNDQFSRWVADFSDCSVFGIFIIFQDFKSLNFICEKVIVFSNWTVLILQKKLQKSDRFSSVL